MDLNKLIPLKFKPTIGCDWVVKGKYLMYKKLEHIPVAFIEDGVVYIFLDNRIPKQIIKLIKWIMELDYEFYLMPPELSNPSNDVDEERVISHYLYSYSQKHFFYGFDKIKFDLINNMVDWCKRENCSYLIKSSYDEVNKKVQRTTYDYWKNKQVYDYNKEIREYFNTLYRDIQISQIL